MWGHRGAVYADARWRVNRMQSSRRSVSLASKPSRDSSQYWDAGLVNGMQPS